MKSNLTGNTDTKGEKEGKASGGRMVVKALKAGVIVALLLLMMIFATERYVEHKVSSMIKKAAEAEAGSYDIEFDHVYFNLLAFDLGIGGIRIESAGNRDENLTCDRLILFRFDMDRSHSFPYQMSMYIDNLVVSSGLIGDSGLSGLAGEKVENGLRSTFYLEYTFEGETGRVTLHVPSYMIEGISAGNLDAEFSLPPGSPSSGDMREWMKDVRFYRIKLTMIEPSSADTSDAVKTSSGGHGLVLTLDNVDGVSVRDLLRSTWPFGLARLGFRISAI